MKTLQLKDRKFALSIPEEQIQQAVKQVAERINRDLADADPLFI